ncbi:MAG: hypothetical protein LBT06_20945 [Hungatella sp.]|jgi:hypothetical protein|nr:hypothetical protein [Hungatella sp.]
MQGLMMYEHPLIRLIFTGMMKDEFGIEIDYTDGSAVLRAVNALVAYDSVEAFLTDTGWRKDNPELCSEKYLTRNRICRWVEGEFCYFSRIVWEDSEGILP